MTYYHLHLFIPRAMAARTAQGLGNGYAFGNDFYPIWLTTRQWRIEHRDPYSPEMTREIQAGLFGRALDARNPTDPPINYREYAYPAFTNLLLWPMSYQEFTKLRVALAAFLLVLTAASIRFWTLAMHWRLHPLWFAVLAVLSLGNYPVLEALFVEQPGLIVGFLLAGSILAIRRNWPLLGGALLSLTLIKPQMTILAAIYLLLWSLADRRRARFCAGFFATTLLLVGASLWIWPHWIAQWTNVLLGYHNYATPTLVALLPGETLGAYIGPVAVAALLGVSLGLAWRYRHANVDSPRFWMTLSLLLAITSITLLPGQAVYDHIILAPGIFLLVQYRRALHHAGRMPRTFLMVGTVVLSWQWLAAFAVTVVYLSSGHLGSIALALPIRTAAPLPFAVLALLVVASRINLLETAEPS